MATIKWPRAFAFYLSVPSYFLSQLFLYFVNSQIYYDLHDNHKIIFAFKKPTRYTYILYLKRGKKQHKMRLNLCIDEVFFQLACNPVHYD